MCRNAIPSGRRPKIASGGIFIFENAEDAEATPLLTAQDNYIPNPKYPTSTMIVGSKALTALFLLATSESTSQAFVPSASASASAASSAFRQTTTSSQLFSTIDKVRVTPPPEVTGDNAAELFEAHVQKTYG